MIDAIKTKEKFNIDIKTLTKQNAIKIVWRCDKCNIEKIKRYDEAVRGNGLCIHCHREKLGKLLGNTYGKAQQLTNQCLYCSTLIRSTHKTCKKHRKVHLTNIRSGSNNPAWTGKHICKCGNKKAFGAKRCRACSFKSGDRSGSNNGRWEIDKSKAIAARTARTVLSNVINLLGKKKSNKTVAILKYSFADFRKHIESQFEPWMNWDNHGNKADQWSIDHIIPVTVLITNSIRDPSIINALWNLRPLRASVNTKRSNSIDKDATILAKSQLNLDLGEP